MKSPALLTLILFSFAAAQPAPPLPEKLKKAQENYFAAIEKANAPINATYQNVRRGMTCLQENGIQSFGLPTSSFRATWLIDRGRLDEAVRLLHALFIPASLG